MFKIHFKKQLLLLIALITFSSVVFSDLPPVARCTFFHNLQNASLNCVANFPDQTRIGFSVLTIVQIYLFPVVIAFTLAFIAIRLFKKLAKKAV